MSVTDDKNRFPGRDSYSHQRISWIFVGKLEDAVADSLERLQSIQSKNVHPSEFIVKWDGQNGYHFNCEIAFDKDDSE